MPRKFATGYGDPGRKGTPSNLMLQRRQSLARNCVAGTVFERASVLIVRTNDVEMGALAAKSGDADLVIVQTDGSLPALDHIVDYNGYFRSVRQRFGGIRRRMFRDGFCHLPSPDLNLSRGELSNLQAIQRHFDSLAQDVYNRDANRFRQIRRYTLLPYVDFLAPRLIAASAYLQALNFNPEAGGQVRNFEAIPDKIANNPLLHALILRDFALSTFNKEELAGPIDVGVHFIRMRAEKEKPGISVPDCLHKDGEPFTFIHLVNRVNVTGGENVVADNNKRIILETTLEEPLDTIGVVDSKVYHQAKRVLVKTGETSGYRDVILIDFTPMVALTRAS